MDQQTREFDREQAYRQEAERLAELPIELQRVAVGIIRAPANDSKLGKRDREEAGRRADAIERHLRRLNRRKKKL